MESLIADKLRDTLNKAKSSNHMYSAFEQFSFLLDRPLVKSAIQEFQSVLIGSIKEEISNTEVQFVRDKDTLNLLAKRDIPPVSATIIWARQTSSRLNMLLGRLSLVAGSLPEAEKIIQDTQSFQAKLDVREIYEKWVAGSQSELNGYVFSVLRRDMYQLVVSFDPSIVELFKEVRNLCWLKFDVPRRIVGNARLFKKVYPHSVTLAESLDLYAFCLRQVDGFSKEVQLLVYRDIATINSVVKECMSHTWEQLARCYDLLSVADELNGVEELRPLKDVSFLEDLIARLNVKVEFLSTADTSLETAFTDLTASSSDVKVRRICESLLLEGFDLEEFNPRLEQRIHDVLLQRCCKQLDEWIFQLPLRDASVHNILFGQELYVDPPLESARAVLLQEVSSMAQVNGTSEKVRECLTAVEVFIEEASVFCGDWLTLQSLWELDIAELICTLGSDIPKWIQVLDEMLDRKKALNCASEKKFGPLLIRFSQAQNKVMAKYESWHESLIQTFSEKLPIDKLHKELSKERSNLQHSFQENPQQLILQVHHSRRTFFKWELQFKQLEQGERSLRKSRFKFPADWVFVDQLEGDLQTVGSLIEKHSLWIDSHMEQLEANLAEQAVTLKEVVAELTGKWVKKRPVSYTRGALSTISGFESQCQKLKDEQTLLFQVCEALHLTIQLPDIDILEEVADYKNVWVSIDSISQELNSLGDVSWKDVDLRVVFRALERLMEKSRLMPVNVRQYAAFEDAQNRVRRFMKVHSLVAELKSEAFQPRHWKMITDVGFDQLRLRNVWDLDLESKSNLLHQVIARANGENLVEKSLTKIETSWQSTFFELFSYEGKCRLVRSWDVIFQQCEDHMNTLSSMRNSPYFEVFELRVTEWIDRLSSLYALLETWIDAQKQWLYLDGVFHEKSDIKRVLPMEYTRFVQVSTDFLSILKKAYHSLRVTDSLKVPHLAESLERQAEMFSRVTRALADYLEKQRDIFPRFYFLGNEDLLELIGQTGDVNKHMKKMFCGIDSLKRQSGSVVGVISQEGETLPLKGVAVTATLQDWLSELDDQIKETLLALLKESLPILLSTTTQDEFLSWIDKYPCQVTLLSVQVMFTLRMEAHQETGVSRMLDWLTLSGDALMRKKGENLVIELIHQRDIESQVSLAQPFDWLKQQRFYLDSTLTVKQGSAEFSYGFEYYGVPSRLVYTPLMDKSFLAMSQALELGLGGSLYGPAGTGKTETIKALGQNLGKMVQVFNCDDSFDFQTVSRIMLGICRVGVWGCFDEFNRLEESLLSAVATEVERIQDGGEIELFGKRCFVNAETGLFITTNPAYEGRTQLPENMKNRYRSMAVMAPDTYKIAEVILTSLQFAEPLAGFITDIFSSLERQCSCQKHYDFGLRSLKVVLVNCGRLKRSFPEVEETKLVVRSLYEMILPRLVPEDVTVFRECVPADEMGAEEQFVGLFKSKQSSLAFPAAWLTKALQLWEMQKAHHGIMVVGKAGCGKSVLWKSVLETLDAVPFVIDCKVMSKEEIFGRMDPATLEWHDGVVTSILRKSHSRPTFIVFDGEIDPEWVETLNSVLDDNKVLTLANGERIALAENVRLLFEVSNLDHATMATVSRCGMVYVPSVDLKAVLSHKLAFQSEAFPDFGSLLFHSVEKIGFERMLKESQKIPHVLGWSAMRCVNTLAECGRAWLKRLEEFQWENPTFTVSDVTKFAKFACFWSFASDSSERDTFSDLLDLDPACEIQLPEIDLSPVQVPLLECSPAEVFRPDLVVPTTETVMYERHIYSLLSVGCPLILCGPPGSGKTMMLMAAIRRNPELQYVGINFSKETTPHTVIASLEQHCVYRKVGSRMVMAPRSFKKLVLFCDEVNLPKPDKYNTQRAVSFLRQMIEHNGFWRNGVWVQLQDVLLVAACNPQTDVGRNEMSERFTRHVSIVMVDYPCESSLKQVYLTLNTAMLRSNSRLPLLAAPLTQSMIQVYYACRGLSGKQPHYVFSPRELTRWVRGIAAALPDDVAGVVDLWAHEAQRLFSDRLVEEEEREWVWKTILQAAETFFPNVEWSRRPLLFSSWLSMAYEPVSLEELKPFVMRRISTFSEEVLGTSELVSTQMIHHILRIDRVMRQPQGHMILVGPSNSGKATLCRFVCWMNGVSVCQLNVFRGYSLENFDSALRTVVKRTLTEKVCLLIDECDLLEASFLERMNTLLANSEVPGLFQPEELAAIMKTCDTEDDPYEYFVRQTSLNLHVVFCVSDPHRVIGSPALFNRCVLDWIGEWHKEAYLEVALGSFVGSESLAQAMVQIHRGVPGKFVAFGKELLREKSGKETCLHEYQVHVTTGMDRLKETVLEVKNLKQGLSSRQKSLQEKEVLARDVLDKMLWEQNESERKKEASVEIEKCVKMQEEEISKRSVLVEADLATAEPAILEAQQGVQNIKKQHLTELRSMMNPPEAVKLTLESVCILLGYDVDSWRKVQSVIRRDDFITSIVRSEVGSDNVSGKMEYFLSHPSYNYETVYRASRACAPLLVWVLAQLRYAEVLERIKPLRDEVYQLQMASRETQARSIAVGEMIAELEENISSSKEKYSQAIRETEKIKDAIEEVNGKVDRSVKLLHSLASERERWSHSVGGFQDSWKTLWGNSLLSAAMSIYAGMMDSSEQSASLREWQACLNKFGIDFSDVPPVDKMQLIQNSTLVPFIIDPSGQVVESLQTIHPNARVASFLDAGFCTHLENVLSFGGVIILTDGEFLDVVVSRILSNEIRTIGHRRVVRLGDREVDISADFKMYIHTRSPNPNLSSFVSSRTLAVSFTTSDKSLHSSVVHTALRLRQPEVELRRVELTGLQKTLSDKLFALEQDLLLCLSESNGPILENENVLTVLDTLKGESVNVAERIQETVTVMGTVSEISSQFEPFAQLCCEIYRVFFNLRILSRWYVFSVEWFMEVVSQVVQTSENLADAFYSAGSVSLLSKHKRVLQCALESSSANEISLRRVIGKSKSPRPIILCSEQDPSVHIELLCDSLTKVALGSEEGSKMADLQLGKCSKNGSWLMIQNVHMGSSWIDYLDKKLESCVSHPDFRLFVTCSLSSHLPTTLISQSQIVVFETSPGMKHIVKECFQEATLQSCYPVERVHVYFLLSWFHALLLDRLRFVPFSWKKPYTFNKTDFQIGMRVIDKWITPTQRSNVSPDKIPWSALSFLIGEIVYGGKVDEEQDLEYLRRTAQSLFCCTSFESSFTLVEGLVPPESRNVEAYLEWIDKLPALQPPTWLGLEANADDLLAETRGREVVEDLEIVRGGTTKRS